MLVNFCKAQKPYLPKIRQYLSRIKPLTITQQKKDLRQVIKKRLLLLSDEYIRKESILIQKRLMETKEYQDSKNISLYLHSVPMKEVHTDLIVQDILHSQKNNKKMFVPRTVNFKNGIMTMLRVYDQEDLNTLGNSSYKTLEPGPFYKKYIKREESSINDLDLIIVPLLACDPSCNRLGRGKGFYDQYLSKYSKKKMVSFVGLTLVNQIFDHIPTLTNDFKLSFLVTPHKIYKK
ncbi:5-formyltetrahydrofolate cyclo-ligase [Anaeramoeba flamelloides]|uniref:5-formyltetrahydrofolate cyclo-ligase n=1 Tax=Anaeramoeba flamelloides TaxID=1746091 RepID=A0ABQ8YRT5_9EUKA|nr:5-formyltetrahydrofolate cyclo-ligase [Anaeramoeba flamelloides]